MAVNPQRPTVSRQTGSDADDYALMRAVAASDSSALGALYDRHKRALFALCLRVLRDRGEAEQVLLDLFLAVWQRPDRYDAARGSPVVYLTMVARSRAIDRRRALAARLDPARPAMAEHAAAAANTPAPSPLEGMVATEQGRRVRAALQAMEAKQREAIELSFFEGLSHAEVARRLGKPLGTVKTYIRSGLVRLRDCLRM